MPTGRLLGTEIARTLGIGGMMNIGRKGTTVLLLALLSAPAGFGQSNKAGTTTDYVTAATTRSDYSPIFLPPETRALFSIMPLDVALGDRGGLSDTKGLPPYFYGHDLQQIYLVLKQRRESTALKGEYETTQEYQQRVGAAFSPPIVDFLGINSIYAFAVSPAFTYNADTRLLDVWTSFGYLDENFLVENDITPVKRSLVRYTSHLEPGESYTATNAYGAVVQVHKAYFTEYSIAFPVLAQNELKFKMSNLAPAEARAAENNVKMLVVCKLRPPYVLSSAHFYDPTFTGPSDDRFDRYYLDVDVLGFWFYELPSGRILQKFTLTAQEAATPYAKFKVVEDRAISNTKEAIIMTKRLLATINSHDAEAVGARTLWCSKVPSLVASLKEDAAYMKEHSSDALLGVPLQKQQELVAKGNEMLALGEQLDPLGPQLEAAKAAGFHCQ